MRYLLPLFCIVLPVISFSQNATETEEMEKAIKAFNVWKYEEEEWKGMTNTQRKEELKREAVLVLYSSIEPLKKHWS